MRQIRFVFLVFGFGLIALVGCNSEGNVVTGKVTFDGKPVAGTIIFTAKGKDVMKAINPDGTYSISKVTEGPNVITIKGTPGALVPKVDDSKKIGGAGANLPTGTVEMSVEPPAKYATEAGGLTFDVKSGKNEHNITLTK